MLTALQILYYLLQVVGVFDKLLEIHDAKVKAKATANAPITKDELVTALEADKV